MVTVVFYNLLRSTYRIKQMEVPSGSIDDIIQYILQQRPDMKQSDFETSVVFFQGKPLHSHGFKTIIPDQETIIITHFVGGG